MAAALPGQWQGGHDAGPAAQTPGAPFAVSRFLSTIPAATAASGSRTGLMVKINHDVMCLQTKERMRWVMPMKQHALAHAILSVLFQIYLAMNAAATTPDSNVEPGSFAAFDRAACAGEALDVVYLGGSLTWGAQSTAPNRASWRALMGRYLDARYPDARLRHHDAAIGGTGSMLGMFRLERDVLRHDPDLVFVEYTVNDGVTGDDPTRAASYETIIRQLVSRGIPVVQVLLGVQRVFDPSFPLDKAARRLQHLRIADAYGTAAADTLPPIRDHVHKGEADLDAIYCFDPTHPDDPGYRLFFDVVRDAFEQAVAEDRVCRVPPQPCFPPLYRRIDRIRLTDQALPAGWTREKNFRVALWHDGLPSRWQDGVIALAAENAESAAPLVVPFRGDTVAVFGEADDRGAGFIARVDGVPLRPDRGGHWDFSTRQFGYSKGQLFVWRILATDLEPGNHTLEIEPVFAPEEPDSQLRIESICAAERRALKEGDSHP
jgi:lysophospholipase L1-like esterase